MARISIKDNELVALLPEHLRESKLTSAAKLILGDLLFLYGRDFAKENGYVFRTNQDLMKDTGIKNGYTVTTTLRKLEVEGFISRDSGKRGKASEYRLNMDKLKDDSNLNGIQCNNDNSNYTVSDSNYIVTEMNVMNSRLERIENLLITKLDTMIEILNKIQVDNNRHFVDNNNSNRHVVDNNRPLTTPIDLQIQTQSTEGDIEAFSMDHTGISSIPEKKLFSNTLKENTKYMKDNEIIGPEVNVVANNENNGMNDNTTNNNIQSLQDLTSDTSDTSTVLLSGDGGIGGMVSSVEENNIQTVQVRTSDALDTPKFCSSGNEGMEVVSDSTNDESTATNGVDTTHTTSEDITIPTVNGSETLQHPTYSSAKPSKIYAKKGAAAVGGDGKGGAGRNISTSAEQLPTSTEKVDNIAPSYSDTASNGEFDMFYAQYGCTREEYEEAQRSFHKSNWRSLPCRFNGQELTMSKVIDKFNEENKEGKKPIETNTYFFILDALESRAMYYERNGKMSQADTDDYLSVIRKKSGRYFTYWTKTFSERMPYEARPSEKRMYDLLVQMGIIGEEQSKKTDITSIPTVNTVDTDFEDEMAYLDFESGTMTKNTL